MHPMNHMVTVIMFAIFGFVALFFLSSWVFDNLTGQVVAAVLGAAAGAALALLIGPARLHEWRL